MPRTTAALFKDLGNAEQAVNELAANGFARDDISLMANKEVCGPHIGPVEDIGTDARIGTGAAIGSVAGFATGILALAIPGIGPVLAIGPLAAGLAGAGIGAVAGGAIGALKRMGVPEKDAGDFCEAIRRGGVMVAVTSSDADAPRAEEIMERHGAVDLETATAQWRERGWTGFDPHAQPVTATPRESGAARQEGLPFDPDDISPSKREARRERRGVRSYTRVS